MVKVTPWHVLHDIRLCSCPKMSDGVYMMLRDVLLRFDETSVVVLESDMYVFVFLM